MSLLICAATPKELAALAPGLFPRYESMPEMRPMRGPVKNGRAIFLATGVGPINAAMAIGFCVGLFHETSNESLRQTSAGEEKVVIDGIIYAGLAGAFNLDLAPLRSIWRVSTEIWPEYGLNDGSTVTARAFRHPQWERKGQPPLYDSIDLCDISALPGVAMKPKLEEWPACPSLTVAGVTASFARRDSLWNAWHAPLENMEGFAAAYTAARAELPLVEIRCVSNKVGPRSRAEKDFDGALKTLGDVLPALNIL